MINMLRRRPPVRAGLTRRIGRAITDHLGAMTSRLDRLEAQRCFQCRLALDDDRARPHRRGVEEPLHRGEVMVTSEDPSTPPLSNMKILRSASRRISDA